MASNVKVIPASLSRFSPVQSASMTKRRVAAYARVSTDNDEQLTSQEAQVDYYTKLITEKPEWDFIGIYADEGISATSTKNRDGFKRMIHDSLNGKIDLILTKSVSRFARNTVDTLTAVRQLKEHGVEIFFEKENIYTFDSKGELFITIMSSLAQEESRSISENVTWGQRKRMADGKISLPYKRFLGYEKGDNDLPCIVEDEAKIVRLIYSLFLEGKTSHGIAKQLTADGILTPGGNGKWRMGTIKSILTNEKYKGDARLQKTFTVDFLSKRKKPNMGEVPQYYVENSHPAIISEDVFEMVQEEIRLRKCGPARHSGTSILSSRIICSDCGGFYGAKVWHSNNKYRKTIWQCNSKFKNRPYCSTPSINEDILKIAFVETINGLIESKDEIIKTIESNIKIAIDFSNLEKIIENLGVECKLVQAALEKLISDNARQAMDQTEYNRQYNALADQYHELQGQRVVQNQKIVEKKTKIIWINNYLDELRKQERLITEFDDRLWVTMIDKVIIQSSNHFLFRFKDGSDREWIRK